MVEQILLYGLGMLVDGASEKLVSELQQIGQKEPFLEAYEKAVKAWCTNEGIQKKYIEDKSKEIGSRFIEFSKNPEEFANYSGKDKSLFYFFEKEINNLPKVNSIITTLKLNRILIILNQRYPTELSEDNSKALRNHNNDTGLRLEQNCPDDFFERYFEIKPSDPDNLERERISFSKLNKEVVNNSLNIIIAGGGLGKSTVLKKIGLNCLGENSNPCMVLYLKGEMLNTSAFDSISDNDKIKRLVDFALSFNVNHLKTHELKQILDTNKVNLIILFDGLNEITNEDYRKKTIRQLENINDEIKCTVVSCSRSKDKSLLRTWKVYKVLEIDENSLSKYLENKYGKDFKSLDKSSIHYLKIPFFLDRVNGENLKIISYSSFINEHLLKNVEEGVDREDLLWVLSEFAMKCYENNDIYKIPKESLVSENLTIGDLIKWQIVFQDEEYLNFEHQLCIELLVANKLSRTTSYWNKKYFDLITENSQNSFEVMQMILEQIQNKTLGDSFLLNLYDWSFYAVLHCLRYVPEGKFSEKHAKAILLVLSEKIFDKFFHTRKNVLAHLKPLIEIYGIKGLNEHLQGALTNYNGESDYDAFYKIIDLNITDFEGTEYYDWLKTFSGQEKITEDLINQLSMEENPVMGWGFANMLKRVDLPQFGEMQLRTIFKSSKDKILRWRVVHSLGASKSNESKELLAKTLKDENEYIWVRFGAARSLMELFFFNDQKDVLDEVFFILENDKIEEVINKELIKCMAKPMEKEDLISAFKEKIQLSKKIDKFRKEKWINS